MKNGNAGRRKTNEHGENETTNGMKILIDKKYEHLRPFITTIPQLMASTQGTTIHDARNLIKTFCTEGLVLNVKRYHRPAMPNLLVYSSGLRKPKGLRAYQYATVLLNHGVETPAPVAYIEERNAIGILGYSYFVSLHCPYSHRLYEFGNAPEGTYEAFSVALAAFTAHMHNEGILHRDYSPGNILWDMGEQAPAVGTDGNKPSPYRFSVVDINRMSFGPVDMKTGCRNFARLWGPKHMIQLIVRTYAGQRGYDADEAERIALDARARFWKRFSRRHTVKFNLEL